MSVDEAQAKVADVLAEAEAARRGFLRSIGIAWRTRAVEIVEQAVIGQPEVTNSADATALSDLKQSVAAAVQTGSSSIDDLFGEQLNLDLLAGFAHLGVAAPTPPDLKIPLEQLVAPLHDLLRDAGYDMGKLKSRKPASNFSSDRFTDSDLDLGIAAELKDYVSAADKLGKARLELAAAEFDVASAKAAARWDAS